MEPLLRLSEVTHRHKVRDHSSRKPWAKREGPGIHSINLDIQPGKILGLIGANGAGKTTLLRVISGLYDADGLSKSASVRRQNIGHMPEQVRWEGRMSVHSTLSMIASMRDDEIDVDSLLAKVGLRNKSETILDHLSQGMRQRLTLACALLGEPQILVMDEPLNGLDPLAQRAFCNLLSDLAAKGVAIVISSHQVAGLAEIIDKVALLHHGQLLIEGDLSEVRDELEIGEDSDLVEMICAATGIDPDDISLELENDAMLPFKSHGGEEE